ncbi:MAG: hypothetical protein WDO24_13650 [Pseudomonadota bacterium]
MTAGAAKAQPVEPAAERALGVGVDGELDERDAVEHRHRRRREQLDAARGRGRRHGAGLEPRSDLLLEEQQPALARRSRSGAPARREKSSLKISSDSGPV